MTKAVPATPQSNLDEPDAGVGTRRHAAPGRERAFFSWVLHPVGLYVASRVLVIVMIRVVVSLKGPLVQARFAGPWPTFPGGHLFLRAFAAWDGSWYLYIASNGYFAHQQPPPPHAQVAFFPVWPILVRWVADVTGLGPLSAGIGLVFVIGALASCAIWKLCQQLGGSDLADRATALWVFFPGSFVLTLVYSEGLTVLLAACCLLLLIRRQWVLAGLAAGIATGVGPDALVLTLCCAWAAGVAVRKERLWLAITAPLLSLVGILSYFGYLWNKTGSALYWYHIEKSIWSSGSDGFYHNTIALVHATIKADRVPYVVSVAGLGFIVLGIIALVRTQAPPLMWIFAIGITMAALASAAVGPLPRMMFVAFPYTVAIAQWLRPTAYRAALGASGFLLATLTLLTLYSATVAP